MRFQHENQLNVNGSDVRYITAGSGRPLVLLHAGGESVHDWEWVIPALSGKYRIVAPQLHYCGSFNGNGNLSSAKSIAGLITGFLRSMGIEDAVLVGNSLGGQVALHIALANPDLASGLVLVGASGLGREITPLVYGMAIPGITEIAIPWATTPAGALMRALVKASFLFSRADRIPPEWIVEQCRLAQTPNFLTTTLHSLRSEIDLGGQREVLLDKLQLLDIPSLVIWGEDDMVIPVSHAYRAGKRLRNGSLEIIPGCGHLPQIEQPDAFTTKLMNFLDQKA